MKLAIMQPYLFPYLGYFQLLNAVDRFVLLDDAAHIRRGWVNRNALAGRDARQPFVFPVAYAPRDAAILDVRLHEPEQAARRFMRTLAHLYGQAPFYGPVSELISGILSGGEERLALVIRHSLERIAAYLGIATPIVSAAERHGEIRSRGARRILDICRAEGATTYLNPEGGTELYDPAPFAEAGIALRFLHHRPLPYDRRGGVFLERLSIVDAMMYNAPEAFGPLLGACDLVEGKR